MHKPLVGVVATLCMVAGCSAPQQSANSGAVAGQSVAVGSVDSPIAENEEDFETIYVPPPVGSLLGGGSVRVPKRSYAGNDENALLGSIRRLNAAAGNKDRASLRRRRRRQRHRSERARIAGAAGSFTTAFRRPVRHQRHCPREQQQGAGSRDCPEQRPELDEPGDLQRLEYRDRRPNNAQRQPTCQPPVIPAPWNGRKAASKS